MVLPRKSRNSYDTNIVFLFLFQLCSVKLQMLLSWIACDAALQPVDLGTEAGIPVWDDGKILHQSFRAWDSFLPKIY